MKRMFAAALICFTSLCCLTGCNLKLLNSDVIDENFFIQVIDEDNIALGNVKTYPQSGAVFFPERIQGYTVSQIGFNSGLGFGGNGYLYTVNLNGKNIERCYFPHTIKEIGDGYMKLSSGDLKIFYCGEVVDLGYFRPNRDTAIYVPAENYEAFNNVLSEGYSQNLLKANVSYHLNYNGNNYYYIDYYENGEKISYIPPIPQRDGYTFGGWFKEANCINEWNFDTDTLQISEETQEIQLYAKWIVGQQAEN